MLRRKQAFGLVTNYQKEKVSTNLWNKKSIIKEENSGVGKKLYLGDWTTSL